MSALTISPDALRAFYPQKAMFRLARDIISASKKDRPPAEKQLEDLIRRYPEPESLIRFLMAAYWSDIPLTPKLIDSFFRYYGFAPRLSNN